MSRVELDSNSYFKLRESLRVHALRLGRVPRPDWRCLFHSKPLCLLHNKCDDPAIGCTNPDCWPEKYPGPPIPPLSPRHSPSSPSSPSLAPPSPVAKEVITIDDDPAAEPSTPPEFRLSAAEAAHADQESYDLQLRCRMYLSSRVGQPTNHPSIIRARRIRKDRFLALLEQAHRWYPDVVDSPNKV